MTGSFCASLRYHLESLVHILATRCHGVLFSVFYSAFFGSRAALKSLESHTLKAVLETSRNYIPFATNFRFSVTISNPE